MGSRKIFSLFGVIAIEGMSKTKAELTAFDKEVRKVNKQLNVLGKEMTNTGKALTKSITAPVIALGASMLVLADNTGKYADQLLDLQQITGLSTDNLQGLEDVARVAGVEFTGLTSTISKFTSKLPSIMNEGGAAAGAIKALGVNIFDAEGNVRDMNDLFPEMVNKLQGITDVTDRNVIAQQIFGKELKDLAPVLGMTTEQFNGMLGGVQDTAGYMSVDALNAANDYRITIAGLKDGFMGLFRDLSTKVIPLLTDTLVPFIQNTVLPIFDSFIGTIGKLITWFNELPKPIKDGALMFTALMVAAGPVLMLMAKLIPIIQTLIPSYTALTSEQIALNVAMESNPIGLIVAGVAALITAGYLLVKNWDTVKTVAINTWSAIKFSFANAIDSIKLGYLQMELATSKAFTNIAKYIPGATKALDGHISKVEEAIAAITAQKDARKADYEVLKASKAMTEEQTKAVEEAKAVVTQYDMSLLKTTKTTKENTDATEEAAAAVQDLGKSWDDAAAFSQSYTDKFEELTFTREQLLEKEKNLALEKATEMGQGTYEVLKYYRALESQNKLEAEKKEREEAKRTKEERIKNGVDIVNNAANQANAMGEIFQRLTDNQVEQINSRLETDIAAVNASRMTEEAKVKAIETLTLGADKQRKDLQKKQARRDKMLAIFNVGIATAQAIMMAFANLPPFIAPVFAAIAAGIGIAQTAIVASKPIPLAKGGLVESDPGRGVIAQIGEGSQDEMVLPMETGAARLADNIMARMSTKSSAGRTQTVQQNISLHIGTLIADNFGLKELERKLNGIRIAEAQRTGFAYGTA